MKLPVSNLTNLLALGSDAFSGTLDYFSYAWNPALTAIILVVAAAAIITLFYARISKGEEVIRGQGASTSKHGNLLIICAVVVAVLMPVLASPIPYWLSTTIAELLIMAACVRHNKYLLSVDLVPWNSLLLVTAVSGVAADRKSTRLNSSHVAISYAVFCLKKKSTDRTGERTLGL